MSILKTRIYGYVTTGAGAGGASAGSANEIQKGNGTGGFSGTKIYSSADGNITMGDNTLAGATRTIGVAGSDADIGLTISGKAGGAVRLESNASWLSVGNNGVLVHGSGITGATFSLHCQNSAGDSALDVSNDLNVTIGPGLTYAAGPRGVLAIANAATVPAVNAVGGGFLYAEGGALKWRGSGGTITTIANA